MPEDASKDSRNVETNDYSYIVKSFVFIKILFLNFTLNIHAYYFMLNLINCSNNCHWALIKKSS